MTEESGFNFQLGKEIFLFCIAYRLSLGPTQPLIQWIPRAGVKHKVCDAHHSPLSDAEFKDCGVLPSFPHMSSWLGAWFIKHRNKFTCTFTTIKGESLFLSWNFILKEFTLFSLANDRYCAFMSDMSNIYDIRINRGLYKFLFTVLYVKYPWNRKTVHSELIWISVLIC